MLVACEAQTHFRSSLLAASLIDESSKFEVN